MITTPSIAVLIISINYRMKIPEQDRNDVVGCLITAVC